VVLPKFRLGATGFDDAAPALDQPRLVP